MEDKRLHGSGRVRWSGVSLWPRFSEIFARPALRAAVFALTVFAAAALLAQGRFLGSFAPFGAAFVAAAAAWPKWRGEVKRLVPAAALLGALAGYLASSGGIDGLKYAAASILCFAAGLVFRGTALTAKPWFVPAVAFTALGAANMVYVLAVTPGVGGMLLFVCEGGMAAAAAYFYTPVIRYIYGARERKRERPPNGAGSADAASAGYRSALIASGISAVIVLSGFTPFAGMSAGRTAGLYLTLAAAGAAGPLYGSAAGLLAGFALDLAAASGPSVAVVYAGAGLIAGAFRKQGAFFTALAFTVTHAALIPWSWADAPVAALFECFAAGVVWFMSNRRVSGIARRVMGEKSARAVASASDMATPAVAAKLRALAAAFGTVGGQTARAPVKKTAGPDVSPYDVAVERVCRSCPVNSECWNRDYQSTKDALASASEAIRARGRAKTQDFPPYFSARCENLSEFVANINENIALRESRSRYRRRAADDSRLLGAQYGAMAGVIEEFARDLTWQETGAQEETRELRRALAARGIALGADIVRAAEGYKCRVFTTMEIPDAMMAQIEEIAGGVTGRRLSRAGTEGDAIILREVETLRATVGVGLRQRRGEDESGDSAAYFRTDEGILYMVLADGMGSGADAARESAAFVRMLEGFLKAGVCVPSALRLLSPAFAVKCGGENFTTCDIIRVDLRTGECGSYKCGAAPTYICPASGRGIRRISAGSVPVGLPDETPGADYARFTLEAGDAVVMVSDGITENGPDEWLADMLSDHRFTGAANLASKILDAGAERTGNRDDMSVLVLKLAAG